MNDSGPSERARAAALRFLAYRPRSEAEVRARLQRRFPAPLVEQVITRLREQELVDDAKFAQLWSDSRDSSKPRSAWAIKRELIAKGVDGGLASEAVQEIDDNESAYRAGLKPARKNMEAGYPTFRRRLREYLHRRGFSDSVSRRTIERLWAEVGEEEKRQ